MMKKLLPVLLCFVLLLGIFAGCKDSGENQTADKTTVFTDDTGRSVTVPETITRVAPSGSVAQMILLTLAPEYLVGVSSEFSDEQLAYLPDCVKNLPVFGQFYGGKGNLNMEALIAAEPEIIIDLGDFIDSVAEDMEGVQTQTGIPTVFIEASASQLADAYRKLGVLLNKQEEAEILAAYIENTLTTAEQLAAQIPQAERKTVLFGTGPEGLACNAAGSSQAAVIDIVGASNAVVTDSVTNKNGGTEVSLEQVYVWDPDVILFAAGGPYEDMENSEWSELSAVKNSAYYEIPSLPYGWMSLPPSVNRIIGIWWLGNLLYPEYFDYDIVEKAQEYYSLFWHYELSTEEAEALLSRSTLK